jgi:CTP synthase
MHDVSNIWRVPLLMQSQDAHVTICKQLGLPSTAAKIDTHAWKVGIADRWDSLVQAVRIVLIGKYTVLSDAYLSVIKALQHACMAAGLKLQLDW